MRNVATALMGAIGSFQPGKACVYRKRNVKVPRCSQCKAIHEARSTKVKSCQKWGITIGVVLCVIAGICIVPWIRGTMGGKIAFILLLCPLLGIIVGLVGGWIVGDIVQAKLPPGVKDESGARAYPSPIRMLEDGWQSRSIPDCPEANQFFEVPPDNEDKLNLGERCRWQEVNGEWIKTV